MSRAKGKAQEKQMREAELKGLRSAYELAQSAAIDCAAADAGINVFCKKHLRSEADRLLANGTFEAHVREYIKKFGESSSNTYNVRYHGDGTTITVWSA